MTTDISLEFVERPHSKYGPQFEIVIVGIAMEDESRYTTERLESFHFSDEQMAKRAYRMAEKLITYCKEDVT